MGKEGIDKLQYSFISPELPKDLVEECVDILDSLNSRKVDKVNWQERKLMDEVTKRSGQYISHEEDAYSETSTVTRAVAPQLSEVTEDEEQEEKPKKKILKEQSPAEDDKEKELLDALGGVMKLLEGYDGKK